MCLSCIHKKMNQQPQSDIRWNWTPKQATLSMQKVKWTAQPWSNGEEKLWPPSRTIHHCKKTRGTTWGRKQTHNIHMYMSKGIFKIMFPTWDDLWQHGSSTADDQIMDQKTGLKAVPRPGEKGTHPSCPVSGWYLQTAEYAARSSLFEVLQQCYAEDKFWLK